MHPLRLYVKDFLCHQNSFIDFTQFNTALIIGKMSNNDLFSNGVGKTTIFKAIEYVLFNQADINLEKIIRDDTDYCNIVFDFIEDGQEYRLSRSRNRKGNSDLSLAKKNAVSADEQIYHTYINDIYIPIVVEKDNKYWQDISCRRTQDTEKELFKIIKINFKSFCSTVHFIQNDFTGLATATATERKAILKEYLNLAIYSKLEKLTKEKASILSKDIDKQKIILANIGDPKSEIKSLNDKFLLVDLSLNEKNKSINDINFQLTINVNNINILKNKHLLMENNFSLFLVKKEALIKDIQKLDQTILNYNSKKINVINSINKLIAQNTELKLFVESTHTNIEPLISEITDIKEQITILNIDIKNSVTILNELKIPLPDDTVCKHCRQKLTEEHKLVCKNQINDDIKKYTNNIKNLKIKTSELEILLYNKQKELTETESLLKKITSAKEVISKNNEILIQQKSVCEEYGSLIEKSKDEFSLKNNELIFVQNDLKKASVEEANFIKKQIENQNKIILNLNDKIYILNKEVLELNNNKAIINNNIEQKSKDLDKQNKLKITLAQLENDYSIYPTVLDAFSSSGIPSLIIKNILNDLQIESNNLLSQLKPGLQLSFLIQKTKANGTEDDTLDITYQVNGKERDYNQLSGSMKLAVNFSLKLGLSSLLQKMIGTNIKFLLLDEIDQSLDKASIDTFGDIIKSLKDDFTILVITHNDRLKEKFSNLILVEQDANMVSTAKVFST